MLPAADAMQNGRQSSSAEHSMAPDGFEGCRKAIAARPKSFDPSDRASQSTQSAQRLFGITISSNSSSTRRRKKNTNLSAGNCGSIATTKILGQLPAHRERRGRKGEYHHLRGKWLMTADLRLSQAPPQRNAAWRPSVGRFNF